MSNQQAVPAPQQVDSVPTPPASPPKPIQLNASQIPNLLNQIRGWPIQSKTLAHSTIITYATYSPWLDDKSFMATYEIIKPCTLVDIYRCYELWNLVAQLAPIEGDVLEVGVFRGGTGCMMANRLRFVSPAKNMILCDTFSGVVKAGPKDTTYVGGEHADTSMQIVQDLAAKLGVGNIRCHQGIFPEQTGYRVSNRKFSLCHIDVDVYESARDVINWVWPRLSVGGCVVFDDYGFLHCEGVTRLVNENMILPGVIIVYNLNGHAIVVKTKA